MPTVLVVDDDFMVADIHRRFVDHTDGFTAVGVAHTAAAALTAVAELDPDLILLDVHLPDTSGLDVLRRLRAEKNPVGVIMITAARELDTVADALSGGAADYLIKPFEYPQLRDKLESFRMRTEALESGAADQNLVDSLFGSGASTDARPEGRLLPLPKGLSAETGRLVLDAVATGAELSASECAEAVGISRVSARRYLEHYLATGAVSVRLQYGRAGRPERRYRSGR
ncbi:response regulator [Rhodococcoides corynebacterioides]|uniref:response regulator n=1 Tax=Rhodococcoides corynebacterioides TaxID=53972 RepID=UPI000B0706B7|nr:response regulator [Rhodococcus corynebacterioides]MBY6350171.1 response regulator [Rhodococcus corynebacterioides]MBY6362240.1 response regulator [Rhodococcus corynebacterioides]